ncbi:acylneuraminate cytidylyltransferase family protein [Aliamphritea hakodatensis]|uniref:acylneuraminate cytidylyltransferase family protein n=1 Tax=Aliamphritea hakodatensis TaxID=2895352 RepID=UPI0022FD66F9|nr:acylneuraminate cytidylyltransferase family protein [Aliamphritea hakodatensis]
MNIYALIPARGGSKRLPNKNIKVLGSKTLIELSISTAEESGCFNKIVVSSDSDEILSLASKANAVTHPRSENASKDSASIIEVVLETLNFIKSNGDETPDAIMILQPTSPFRTTESIIKAVDLFVSNSAKHSVVSVSPAKPHPLWTKTLDKQGNISSFISDFDETIQSQGLSDIYALNGLLYLFPVTDFLSSKSFYTTPTKGLIINSSIESLDIDTPDDWAIAEAVYNARI